jgi:hypothetical protein
MHMYVCVCLCEVSFSVGKGKVVPVLNQAPRHEGVLVWRNSSTHS